MTDGVEVDGSRGTATRTARIEPIGAGTKATETRAADHGGPATSGLVREVAYLWALGHHAVGIAVNSRTFGISAPAESHTKRSAIRTGDRGVVDAAPARDVEVLRQRLEAVAVDYAEGVVTQEQLHAATRTLRARIAELDGVLAASTRSRALSVVDGVPDLREAWDGFDLDTRRAVVRALWRVELVPQRSGTPGVHPDGVLMTPAVDV